MKGFYVTGDNGSYAELEDGRYADTVIGDTSEDMEAHEALSALCEQEQNIDWVSQEEWQEWSNWFDSQMDIKDHVAVEKFEEATSLSTSQSDRAFCEEYRARLKEEVRK